MMIQKLQFGGRTDRGVSEVLGAILIFALLLILLVIVQTAAVPAMNQQIEFAHNQRVQGDMQSFGEQVDFTATRGAESSTTIEMGVQYPTRLFLLNPPPASGSLTTEATTFAIGNATALDGETADYWDGNAKNFDSRRLTYAPNYNEYAAAPNTVYEGWALYNQHANDQDLGLDETSPVNDNRVRLVALDGTRGETSVAPITLSTQPISVPEQTVAITDTPGETDPITLRLATTLSQEAWDEILAGECADTSVDPVCTSGDGHITDWTVDGGTLTIVLEEGVTYELRMSKVGIGSGTTDEEPAYVTAIDALPAPNRPGTDLTVEVRDQFNTGKSNVDVTFEVTTGAATPAQKTVETGEDGRATATFDIAGPTTIQAYYGSYTPGDAAQCQTSPECVLYTLTESAGDTGGSSSQGETQLIFRGASADPANRQVTYQMENVSTRPLTVTGIRLVYATSLRKTGGGQGQPSTATLIDGPNSITSFTLSGQSRTVNSDEGEEPKFFSPPIRVESGTTSLQMTLDTTYEFDPGEAIIFSVRLYFATKDPATYEVYIFAP